MNRLLRTAIILSALVPMASLPCRAEEQITVSKYVCTDLEGNKRWEAINTIKPQNQNGLYLMTENGSGTYSGFDVPVKWRTDTEFSDDGTKITPIRMKKSFASDDGKTLFEGTQEFDPGKNIVTCIKRWPGSGKEVSKTLKYKGDVVNDCLLGLYVERFLAKGDTEKSFYLISNDPEIYKISARIKNKEDITINGIAMPAYKISLDPEVGIFGVFAPKTYVWHLARPGYDWLKYKGAEDTINSIVVEMETLDQI